MAELCNFCRIVNLKKTVGEYHLGDGRILRCGPFAPGLSINKTTPFRKEFITPHLSIMEKKGVIRFENVKDSEV